MLLRFLVVCCKGIGLNELPQYLTMSNLALKLSILYLGEGLTLVYTSRLKGDTAI